MVFSSRRYVMDGEKFAVDILIFGIFILTCVRLWQDKWKICGRISARQMKFLDSYATFVRKSIAVTNFGGEFDHSATFCKIFFILVRPQNYAHAANCKHFPISFSNDAQIGHRNIEWAANTFAEISTSNKRIFSLDIFAIIKILISLPQHRREATLKIWENSIKFLSSVVECRWKGRKWRGKKETWNSHITT